MIETCWCLKASFNWIVKHVQGDSQCWSGDADRVIVGCALFVQWSQALGS